MARLLLLILLSLTTTALAETAPATQPTTRPARELAVVRTLAELRKQPVIELPGGGRVQLGIETHEPPARSAVLVYCLAEGDFKVRQPGRMKGGAALCGPVVAHAVGRVLHAETLIRTSDLQELRLPGLYLYAAWVELDEDESRVEIETPEGQPLAATVLKPSPDVAHPWYRWSAEPEEFAELTKEDEKTKRFRVRNARTEQVWPSFGERQPLAMFPAEPDKLGALADQPLPRLATLEADPDMKLSLDGRTLTLRREQGLPFHQPLENLLVRWWVNDRPQELSQVNLADESAFALREAEAGAKELHLELDLVPERLNAKSGDRIKLQILHSPHGWLYPRRHAVLMKQQEWLLQDGDISMPRASNTVEFTLD